MFTPHGEHLHPHFSLHDALPICEGDAERTERYAKLAHHFRAMKELALLLNARRNEHGSIDFDLPEPVIEFDEKQRMRSEEHTSELQSHSDLVCRLLLEKKKKKKE